MATCAICELPITKLQRLVVQDTEVLHRTCATTGRATALQRALQQARDAEALAAASARNLVVAASDCATKANQIVKLRRDLEQYVQLNRAASRRNEANEALLQAALRDLAAARAALPPTQTPAQEPLAAGETVGETTPTPDPAPMDDAEIRYSLLELH